MSNYRGKSTRTSKLVRTWEASEEGVKGDCAVSRLGDHRKGDILSLNKNTDVAGVQGHGSLELKRARVFRRSRLFIISSLV